MENETIEILLIEDDLAEAGMIGRMLAESRQPGYSVQHVRNLADGLRQLATRAFDVILAVLALPDSNGLETAQSLRNQAKMTPIVAMISPDDEEAVLKATQSDFQDYLIRGRITGDVLKRSIRYAIQRKRDMEACQRCEQWFASFMLHLPVAAWVKDLHGRYVYANEGDERIFSMPFSEYSGKRDEEFLPPETASQLRRNDEKVLAEGESLQMVEFLRQADGIEHHYIVNKFPIPGPNGQPAYVAGIALDITERAMAVEALRKSERKFEKIFHGVPALVGISTLEEGRFLDVNDTTLSTLGYRREEMIGRSALELNLWEDLADRAAMLRALEEKGSVKNLEVGLRGKSGQKIVGLLSAEYIELDGDRYLLSLVRDITLKKQAEKEVERLNTELVEANKELDAFNYTVAHDLRKPLTAINGYCQIVQEVCGNNLDDQCKKYLQEAYDGTWRMNQLIDTLLNFSRATCKEPLRETVDLSGIAREVANGLKQAEPERRGTFRIAEGISVTGDPNLLRVVLENLLGNAWKYVGIREEALIEFGTAEIDGRPACFVRDNGPGFAPEDADKLFVPFQRLPGAEEHKGFGIGLATVDRIIRRHDGRVWAEGEPGKGATFYFMLGAMTA